MFLRHRIRAVLFLFLYALIGASPCSSQVSAEQVQTDTLDFFGTSANSVNNIKATALRFEYPIRDFLYDSLSKLFFVSGKQQGQESDQVMVKGFFAAIDQKNKVKWIQESSLLTLQTAGGQLLVSNEERSAKYNKLAGYDELKLPGKVLLTFDNSNLGWFYPKGSKEEMQCVDLRSGLIKWSAKIPAGEDWLDYEYVNDSLILLAASGIQALDLHKGLLWSLPMSTAVGTSQSLTHSIASERTLQKPGRVVHTAFEENLVTQLASNLLVGDETVFFASKEKCMALDLQGKEKWSMDLRNYPVSKMILRKSEAGIQLINLGLAMHSDRFVSWGSLFVLVLDPLTGKIVNEYKLNKIENLADFIKSGNSLVFAGKQEILTLSSETAALKAYLEIKPELYGKFSEFVDGNEYYILKEGYYVPLNFINSNLIYFKTDNNKVYGMDGDYMEYECHFTELYRILGKLDEQTLLSNGRKTILISKNFELTCELSSAAPTLVGEEKIFFIEENRVVIVEKENLR